APGYRSTRRTRPPQPPWPRAWGGQGNSHHGRWPLPPAYGYAAFGFRRSLLSYRRTRTAAARRGSPGTERAFSNSGAGGGTAIGKHLIRDAVPSRVHIIGGSRVDRDAGRKSRCGGGRSRLCRVGRHGPRFPRATRHARTPRPGLALRHRPRDLGSCLPYSRDRQLAAGGGEDFRPMISRTRGHAPPNQLAHETTAKATRAETNNALYRTRGER